MPISGLVLSLREPVEEALAVLRTQSALELGELNGQRVPAVLETSSLRESEDLVRLLATLPGVLAVDVVTVDFTDCTELENLDAAS